jgi:hypothetical protein
MFNPSRHCLLVQQRPETSPRSVRPLLGSGMIEPAMPRLPGAGKPSFRGRTT